MSALPRVLLAQALIVVLSFLYIAPYGSFKINKYLGPDYEEIERPEGREDKEY